MVLTKASAVRLALVLALTAVSGIPAIAGQAEDARDGAERIWDLLEKKFKDKKDGEGWLNRKFENRKWFDRIAERENEKRPLPPPPPARGPLPTEGVVTDVADGDTLTVAGVGRIRLQGVDTPEKLHPTKPVQYLAEEASKFSKSLLTGQKVRLEYGKEPYDKYGRVLAYIYLQDGRMINAELIKAGLAYAYTRYPFKYQKEFVALEAEAREKGLGLWADQGLGEFNWLRARSREGFQVFEMSSNLWGIQWGDLVLVRLTTDQLRVEIEHLRKDVHAFGPRDLERELTARGYQKAPKVNS